MFKLCILILAAAALAKAKPNTPRIVGGSPAEQGQFPFLASLQNASTHTHFCGAAIINEHYLVSAAQCVFGLKPDQVAIYLGSVYLSEGGTYYSVEELIPHPGYSPNQLPHSYDDIGLIRLKEQIQFDDNIQPINLPPIDYTVNPGETATVTGWGDISYPNERSQNQLQYLTSKVVDSDECATDLNTEIYRGELCFGGDDGHGLCFGDSGSPLVYTVNDTSYMIGAVTWGFPCGIGYPDVSTATSIYVGWIHGQMKP